MGENTEWKGRRKGNWEGEKKPPIRRFVEVPAGLEMISTNEDPFLKCFLRPKRATREPPDLSFFVNSVEPLRKRETLRRVKLRPRRRLERLGFDSHRNF